MNHYGPGWWADLPLDQREKLRAEDLSEYNLQRKRVFMVRYKGRFVILMRNTHLFL